MKKTMDKLITIFLISINICGISSDKTINCCPPNYFVTNSISFPTYKCWDPLTNNTEPIRIQCEESISLYKYKVNENQQLEYKVNYLYTEKFESDVFCIGNRTTIRKPENVRSAAVLCFAAEEPDILDEWVLGACMLVSVVFLGITTIIYCCLPEMRSDLQGKSFICFSGCLGLGLAVLSILQLYKEYSDMNLCAARGFTVYFFILSAFFWSTAISIQVLISTRKPAIVSIRGWKEFSWYALFAWGCPGLLTIILIIVNYHPGPHRRPNIGLIRCWFYTKEQQWIYMYSVMSILLTVNIGIFIYTATIIWGHRFTSSHVKAVKYKLVMTARLIILMGLPWVFEMISSLMKKHIMWSILDIFNCLQGFLVFLLLVVFRKRVISAMYNHGWLNCISGPVEKFLAKRDDAEENVVQHTDVPMNDRLA